MKKDSETRHFLVVEDDANDAIQIRRIFNALTPKCTLFVSRNTSEARSYLKGAGMYADRKAYPMPDAVISDIRLPEESGIELIRWLRTEKQFADIPVVILTGAAAPSELEATKALGVALVLRKPAKPSHFRTLLQSLTQRFCTKSPSESVPEVLRPYIVQ